MVRLEPRTGCKASKRPRLEFAGRVTTLVRMRIEPTDVQLIGDEVAIHWSDGAESFLAQEFLRRACPCAACGGEPDVLGQIVRPQVTYNADSFQLRRWEFVGGYALQPSWADGHRTGIYSYQYLRRLAEAVAG